MDFKEYSFHSNIRVCVYNVGNDNLEYHKHTHISDITYCAQGELMIELPEINRSFIFHTGQIVQIPSNMIHRVSHYSKTNKQSRYILIQIGKFSIDFIKDDRITISENYVDIKDKKINYYIGSHQENIKTILLYFIENRPTNLSNAEYINVLEALNVVYKDAVLQIPTNDILLQQLKDI